MIVAVASNPIPPPIAFALASFLCARLLTAISSKLENYYKTLFCNHSRSGAAGKAQCSINTAQDGGMKQSALITAVGLSTSD